MEVKQGAEPGTEQSTLVGNFSRPGTSISNSNSNSSGVGVEGCGANIVVGKVSDRDLHRFFSKYGRRIRHLTLKPEFTQMAELDDILLKWTPNLKSLIFQPQPTLTSRRWWEAEAEDDDQLKNCKDETSSSSEYESSSESESESNFEAESEPPNVEKRGQSRRAPRFLIKLQKIILTVPNRASTPNLTLTEAQAEGQGHIIYKILTCAPNLTSIEDPCLAFVPQIISAGKFPLITSLKWDFFQNSDFEENFVNFVAAGPTLTSVTFELFEDVAKTLPAEENRCPNPTLRVIPALIKLFTLGQETLTKIEGIQALGQICQIGQTSGPEPCTQFRPLSNVTHLTMTIRGPVSAGNILPVGNQLSQFLPNLKSMTFELGQLCSSSHAFISSSSDISSPKANAHSLLEKLKISNYSSDDGENVFWFDWLEPLANLYQNVTHLHLALYKWSGACIQDSLRIIFERYQQLENLVLEIWIENENMINSEFTQRMDEIITGSSFQDYKELLTLDVNHPKFQSRAATFADENRPNASILDLKKLTSLTFEVHFKGQATPLWTQVSQGFAFQQMAARQEFQVIVRGTQHEKDVQLTRNDLGPL